MSNLKERLDLLRQEIQKDEFLDGSGLSFEVNIRMFCYDAKDEMIGDVFPFMRVHALLEALQPQFSDIPILVMYPGKFDGYHLTLFDRLKPNDYYRAFNIVCGV